MFCGARVVTLSSFYPESFNHLQGFPYRRGNPSLFFSLRTRCSSPLSTAVFADIFDVAFLSCCPRGHFLWDSTAVFAFTLRDR